MDKKGFTLLELLIVMGIIVILTGVLVTVINPVELMRRARDTRRLNDTALLNRALGLYVTDIASPQLDGTTGTANDKCNGGDGAKTLFYSGAADGGAPTGWTANAGAGAQGVTGSGWIPINFTAISAGSPIAVEPIDPTNSNNNVTTTHLYYTYACDKSSLTWEIDANMESTTNKQGGTADKESTDGGDIATVYEIGSYAGLSLLPTTTSASFYNVQ